MKLLLNKYLRPLPLMIAGLGFLAIISLSAAGYIYWKNHRPAAPLVSPESPVLGTTSPDSQKTIAKIGALIQLPVGEDPTVATITDKTKLAANSFFSQSENGDVVLIYPRAKKAILYRPSANKIIDVAPVSINTPSPSATSSATPTP